MFGTIGSVRLLPDLLAEYVTFTGLVALIGELESHGQSPRRIATDDDDTRTDN